MQEKHKNSVTINLFGKLIEELKLRKYSYRTGKKDRDIVIKFLKSGKKVNTSFLISYSD